MVRWETLGPGMHGDVILAFTAHINLTADHVHPLKGIDLVIKQLWDATEERPHPPRPRKTQRTRCHRPSAGYQVRVVLAVSE